MVTKHSPRPKPRRARCSRARSLGLSKATARRGVLERAASTLPKSRLAGDGAAPRRPTRRGQRRQEQARGARVSRAGRDFAERREGQRGLPRSRRGHSSTVRSCSFDAARSPGTCSGSQNEERAVARPRRKPRAIRVSHRIARRRTRGGGAPRRARGGARRRRDRALCRGRKCGRPESRTASVELRLRHRRYRKRPRRPRHVERDWQHARADRARRVARTLR